MERQPHQPLNPQHDNQTNGVRNRLSNSGIAVSPKVPLSVVIPTYRREQVLLDTIQYLRSLQAPPAEIIVVDQTGDHEVSIQEQLNQWDRNKEIRWVRLEEPSIPGAMNKGLLVARNNIVLFLDDDIIPSEDLIMAHASAHGVEGVGVVAGKVIQPWDIGKPPSTGKFSFASGTKQFVHEFMGGNFSVERSLALTLGGFDENFVHVAYRFEAEFSERVLAGGYKILYEPGAIIRHLKVSAGGTRSYGNFLTTIKPSHAVGEYYYLLKSRYVRFKVFRLMWHPLRAVRTRHHLRHPWQIPVTLIAELQAFFWALFLVMRGPRLLAEKTPARGENA